MFKRDLINSQKIIVTDGLPGSGKLLIANLISSLPKVEQFSMNSWFEQILSLAKIKKINQEAAINLIRTNHNQIIYDSSIFRNSNFRKADVSSVYNHLRFNKMRERLIKDEKTIFKKYKNKIIIHYCTHIVANFSEPLLKAFGNKLVFVRIFRSPLNLQMIKRLAYFMRVWEKTKSRDSHIKVYDKKSKKNIHLSIYNKKIKFLTLNYFEKSILMLENYLKKKEIKNLDKLSKKHKVKIVNLHFEKLATNPIIYISKIAKLLNVKIDKTVFKALKINNIPRKINYENEKKECINFLKYKVSKIYYNKIIKLDLIYKKYISSLS